MPPRLSPGKPDPVWAIKPSQRLALNPNIVTLHEQLGGEHRTEVPVLLTNQRDRVIANAIGDLVVGLAATRPVRQCRATLGTQSEQQPIRLPHAKRERLAALGPLRGFVVTFTEATGLIG